MEAIAGGRATERLQGGSVHQVERITEDGVSYIRKTRTSGSPAELPGMVTRADEMVFEAKALRDAHRLMPRVFAKVLDDTAAEQGVLIMTELFNGRSRHLKSVLNDHHPSDKLVADIARSVGDYHRLAGTLEPGEYRGGNFFEELLAYRFGMLEIPAVDTVTSELLADGEKGVIHGGLSPKNILIENGTNAVGFVDLETSCIGSRYFDIGFSLGHLMLHGLDKGADIQQIYEAYIDTYKKGNPAIQINDDMVRRVCLTTMLYRLRHPEARYTLDTFDEAAVMNFTDYAVAEIKSTALK